MEKKPRSRPVTSTVAYLAAVGGELYFLRGPLSEGLSALSGPLLAELAFCILIVGAAIFAATPKGWRSKAGNRAALALLGLYLLFNLLCFSYFKELYLSVLATEHQSYGPALEALKLILVMIGTVAAIPVMPGPVGRDYMRGLERAMERQQAEWAKGGAVEEKVNLGKTARNLRENLTQEELSELIAQLKQEPSSDDHHGTRTDTAPASEAPRKEPLPEGFSVEDWKGCGCG